MPSGSDTTAEAAPTGPDADRPGQRTTGSAATPPTEGADGAEGGDAVGGPDPVEGRDAVEGGEPRATASAASGTASTGPGTASAPSAGGRRPGRLRRLGLLARREARRSALAVISGLALGLAFPPFGVWPLSLVAAAALALLTHGRTARQGAWTGFAFGVPFFLLLLKWLSVVGWDAVVGLSIIEAAFLALMGAGLALVSRLPVPALWPLWTACLWVAEEWARDRVPFGGFPWGRLAFANTGSPYTPLAALGGAPLVTFGVALTGGALAGAALTLWRLRGAGGFSARRALPAAGAVAVAAAVTAAGFAVPIPTAADDSVDIAVVQGNVQQPGMDFLGRPMMILDNHVKATLNLAKDVKAGRIAKPDLVIWPENASDLDPFQYREAYARIDEAVRAIGVPVLVGALVDHPTKQGYVENQGIVWDPKSGPGASYTKQHPVPFGEYVPFRQELSKVITRLQRVPRDFYPGDHTGVLNVGPARLGDVICFEVAYDEIVRDTVNAGARAIVVQTNNATYGRSGQPEQQLVMSKLRAIEHGRPVITAATSGISAVVAPDGTIEQRTKEFTQDVLTARIPLRDGKTLADRVGATPEWVLAMVGVLSCAAAIMIGRRGRTDEKGQ
ncbi:apolipoprotein N-acyltransferase [Streptomyces rapamycinicus]|uniref:Apolipoprotein N-acyltransferase n=2 Tax=Streptomyces rapamycinicus TaxID=1226757 RepID=A0A3L8R4R5_STRRN|nr:apolipoprotein N-acyltransferase [Streptomyces rapamycinicus]MBB4781006.1 apolipoprotein N-acyltransferase [Streptomyces rapamycinicus]RLV74348.1 apolipoprotein N-acyltransferase [Streptomyces rapamycinicus NRRL 5491]UTP29623.1 apolipoprotein N-acyltransferase [Streptomyces rapamycinicus NRRL 5491]